MRSHSFLFGRASVGRDPNIVFGQLIPGVPTYELFAAVVRRVFFVEYVVNSDGYELSRFDFDNDLHGRFGDSCCDSL
jgi:hypothetical protein